MSGFAGVISLDGEIADPQLLERMTARLAFRGPDAKQIWSRPGAGFCFTLLRTGPAPQASEQPCTLDGRVWLLGDIRLDGRDDLIRELEQTGENSLPGVTDEELVLHAWRKWGENGLPKLLGDFAFALWDADSRQLWCVRDLLGVRPFFYAQAGGNFYFSNTLDVVRLASDLPATLDRHFLGDFLLQEMSLDAWRTTFAHIRRLQPGFFLRYSETGLAASHYTKLPIEDPLWLKEPGQYIECFRGLLKQAVGDRLPNDASAIFMSGGLDSTSIAAVATSIARNRGIRGISHAYTLDCRPLFDDEEGPLASLVADRLGLQIELSSGTTPPYEGWGRELRISEPTHDPFLLQSRKQYRSVSRRARVAFTGYGGDDVLTGQSWPYIRYLFRNGQIGRMTRDFGQYFFTHRRFPPLRAGIRAQVRRWIGRENPLEELPKWLKPDFVQQQNLQERWLCSEKGSESHHSLHPVAHEGLSSHFWSGVFELEDSGSTDVPVEMRAPLLDTRVLRFLLRLPPVPWCVDKELLRRAMADALPDEIRLRPKTPLPDDSFQRLVDSGTWKPAPLLEPSATIHEFVDWDKFCATLSTASGSGLWVALRPVSLDYWLKGVENP